MTKISADDFILLIRPGGVNSVVKAMKLGADPNRTGLVGGYPPLVHAIEIQDIEIVEALISGGANLEYRDSEGNTLLHFAVDVESDGFAQYGEESIPLLSKILLGKGVDPHIENLSGQSAYDEAVELEYQAFIDLVAELDSKKEN